MKKFIVVLLSLFLCTGLCGAEKQLLSTALPRPVLAETLIAPRQFAPVPVCGDKYWQENIPASIREAYIKNGEQYLGKPWEVLPVTVFSQFRTIGDRTNFQRLSFGRRTQLNALVMAELMENKGRFMDDILNGIWALCEETWWGIPAHYGPKVSLPQDQTVDLFAAETGSQLAWINYVLKAKLDAFSPLVSERLEKEIKRRIVDRALADEYWWMTSAMNWNTWICSNWLTCVLFVEPDRETQLRSVEKIMRCVDFFIDEYNEDGGCDEGPGYWNHAAGALWVNLNLLKLATDGRIDLSRNQKINNMGEFIYKTYVGNGYGVNFADASPRVSPNFSVLYQFGQYLDNPMMMEYAAWSADQRGDSREEAIVRGIAAKDLLFLTKVGDFLKQEAREPQVFDSWLPDVQVVTAHSVKGSNDGLFFAAKGGHNDESHNHNDVGNFVVYYDTKPVIVDVGSVTYTAKTFVNSTRYTLWPMQSGYHNTPMINGKMQPYGRQYEARDISCDVSDKKVVFKVDLAKCYDDDAKVKSWLRTCTFTRGKQLEVEERYQLEDYVAPTQIILMTPYVVSQQDDGLLRLVSGDEVRHVKYDPKRLSAEVETVVMDDQSVANRWGQLYRIKLTVMDKAPKGSVKYSIY